MNIRSYKNCVNKLKSQQRFRYKKTHSSFSHLFLFLFISLQICQGCREENTTPRAQGYFHTNSGRQYTLFSSIRSNLGKWNSYYGLRTSDEWQKLLAFTSQDFVSVHVLIDTVVWITWVTYLYKWMGIKENTLGLFQ